MALIISSNKFIFKPLLFLWRALCAGHLFFVNAVYFITRLAGKLNTLFRAKFKKAKWFYSCLKLAKVFFALALLFLAIKSFAWTSTGHRIVAYMAYQQLSLEARSQVDQLSEILDPHYGPLQRFMYISVLPDKWRSDTFRAFIAWHYINQPYSLDGTPVKPASAPNLQTGLLQTKNWLTDPNVGLQQKALSLSLLIHLVADAHQPLHCINYFSGFFPKGDAGGNRFPIKDFQNKNLHFLWDQGVGSFQTAQQKRLSNKQIKVKAREILLLQKAQQKKLDVDCDISRWLQECYYAAIKSSYNIEPNSQPTVSYIGHGQKVVDQQLFWAAKRLAAVLNTIYDRKDAAYANSTSYPYCRSR